MIVRASFTEHFYSQIPYDYASISHSLSLILASTLPGSYCHSRFRDRDPKLGVVVNVLRRHR